MTDLPVPIRVESHHIQDPAGHIDLYLNDGETRHTLVNLGGDVLQFPDGFVLWTLDDARRLREALSNHMGWRRAVKEHLAKETS